MTDKERMIALEVVLRQLAQILHEEFHSMVEYPTFEGCSYLTCRKATVVLEEGVVLL